MRLDTYLAGAHDLSRTAATKLIKDGLVQVGGLVITKPSFDVTDASFVTCDIPEASPIDIVPEDIPLDILYEDDDVIVVNKPKGMVVHPAPGHYTGTLVNALLWHCGDTLSGINGVLRPGIVHRIDKDTTGSVIACKNDRAHECIAAQLAAHSIKRVYEAICVGCPRDMSGTIDAPIGRSSSDRKRMAVVASGRHAVTHYEVIERLKGSAYLKIHLETGRTHQIRVHMAYIGHPVLGDPVYGKAVNGIDGQCLHAAVLGFIRPSDHAYIECVAPLPEYFANLLRR